MDKQDIIVVTGAAGFIASALVAHLNSIGFCKLILVDKFDIIAKKPNVIGKQYIELVDRDMLFDWLEKNDLSVKYFFHLGARTDTTEQNHAILKALNFDYSIKVWQYCTEKRIPLVYASSAATYGNGELGYDDRHEVVSNLHPLNPYGISKNEFDKWALQQMAAPPFWAGLKFFNVYGPNEYHKGRMASVVFHGYNQIMNTGAIKLFRSHNEHYKDGEQLRDFIYVKDVVNVCVWLAQNSPASGLYNLGTGTARTFLALARAIFAALHLSENIVFMDTPIDIRDKYQYFTEANMNKLRDAGYNFPFYDLETGVADYVFNYLKGDKHL
jgi:ADP-L-glycero-D-manno-heptose 6-epimerase